jgi:hypothetical protein
VFARDWRSSRAEQASSETNVNNASEDRLRAYFDSHQTGKGIWKWTHYFDIYERYFHRFVGTEVVIVEIGIYSGGSLDMWKNYFGPRCQVYGIDIESACKAYEGDTSAFASETSGSVPGEFKKQPRVDILIDDGGHTQNSRL